MNENVIIFNDGSKKWINKIMADKIIKVSTDDNNETENVLIYDDMIKLKSISKLLTRKEFNEQYPKDRVDPPLKKYKQLQIGEVYETLEKRIEAKRSKFKSFLKGLKGYIDDQKAIGITPKNAMALYDEKLKKYNILYEDVS